MLPKLSGPDPDSSVEFVHPDVWERQDYPGYSRLLVGSREGEIDLILEMCRSLRGPFLVLHVLLVSRSGHEPARYESPDWLSFEDLELFLWTYQDYFEQEGRMHLWVISTSGDGQIIFDNHNMIYAYGPLEAFEKTLSARGYQLGEVRIPAPHCHRYHQEFDVVERELMSHWEWRSSPLQDSDDP